MAPTPESILFDSLFFRWASSNGDTFSVESVQNLIEEGVATPNIYLLLENVGEVRTARENGELVTLAEIGPGQFVGEMSLLEDRLPVATVVAMPGSRWIRVSYSLLQEAMRSDKALAASAYQVFACKLALQLNRQNAFIHRWPGVEVEPLRKVLLVFGEWNELDVAWLAGTGERLDVEPGQTLIQEGEPVDQLFVVLDGEADVVVSIEGTPTSVGSSRRGEMLGEMSFLGDDGAATASVKATEAMLLLAISKERIRHHLEADLAFAERFYRSLAVLLSHRSRDQLISRGMAAQAMALEELDLSTLSHVTTAGRRFEWLCEEVAQR